MFTSTPKINSGQSETSGIYTEEAQVQHDSSTDAHQSPLRQAFQETARRLGCRVFTNRAH
ncbi:hypothetical protein ACU8KH_00530 [Lachancea thermotolerans]